VKTAKLILGVALLGAGVWLFFRHSLLGGLLAGTIVLIVLGWGVR
jgi:hypothetical protein